MTAPATTRHSSTTKPYSRHRAIDLHDVPKLVSTDDDLYVGFTAFDQHYTRSVAKAGAIALESFTGKPAKGDKTMLQRFTPTVPLPDGWDEDQFALAEECPALYSALKPTDPDQFARYGKWLGYYQLKQSYEWYGKHIWTTIRECCDKHMKDLIDAKNMDESDGRALYAWVKHFCLGEGGSIRRRHRTREFNDTHYEGGDVHTHVATMRQMQTQINACGQPVCVKDLVSRIQRVVSALDVVLDPTFISELISYPDFIVDVEKTIEGGLRADHTPTKMLQAHRARIEALAVKPGTADEKDGNVSDRTRARRSLPLETPAHDYNETEALEEKEQLTDAESVDENEIANELRNTSIWDNLSLMIVLVRLRDFIANTVLHDLTTNHVYLDDERMADHFIDDIYSEGTYKAVLQQKEGALNADEILTFDEATSAVLRIHINDRAHNASGRGQSAMIGDAGRNTNNRNNNGRYGRNNNDRNGRDDRKRYDCPHCKNVPGHPHPGNHTYPPEACFYNPAHERFNPKLNKFCTKCGGRGGRRRGMRANHVASEHDAYWKKVNELRDKATPKAEANVADTGFPDVDFTDLVSEPFKLIFSPAGDTRCNDECTSAGHGHEAMFAMTGGDDTGTDTEGDTTDSEQGCATDTTTEDVPADRPASQPLTATEQEFIDALNTATRHRDNTPRASLGGATPADAACIAAYVAATAAMIAATAVDIAWVAADAAFAWSMRHTQWSAESARTSKGTRSDGFKHEDEDSGSTDYSDCSSTFDAAVDRHMVERGLDIHLEPLNFGGTPAQNATTTVDLQNCSRATRGRPINETLQIIATTTMNATLRDIVCYRRYMSLARAFNALRFVAYDTWTETMVFAQRIAAITIQSAIRGWITRLTLACDEITRSVQTRMVVRIQSAVRGALSRMRTGIATHAHDGRDTTLRRLNNIAAHAGYEDTHEELAFENAYTDSINDEIAFAPSLLTDARRIARERVIANTNRRAAELRAAAADRVRQSRERAAANLLAGRRGDQTNADFLYRRASSPTRPANTNGGRRL